MRQASVIDGDNLYQRDGVWYANVMLSDGQRIRQSMKTKDKQEAKLRLADLLAGIENQKRAVTFGQYADGFYHIGSAFMERRADQGHTLSEFTRTMYQRIVDKFLIPFWGDKPINEIKGPAVERFVKTIKKVDGEAIGNSYRNETLRVMLTIWKEAIRDEVRTAPVVMEAFARDGERKDTLTDEELERLFPVEPADLADVWRSSFRYDPPIAGLMFGTLYALMVSAGLRSGEARALEPDHVFLDDGAVVVAQAWTKDGEIGLPKKGSEADPKFRAVLIPERTVTTLRNWMPNQSGRFVFEYAGEEVKEKLIRTRFAMGLRNAGIDTKSRNLTPHCLRYTYNTRMEMKLPGDVLRHMIGHKGEAMTALYSRPVMVERIKQIQGHRTVIDSFWG